MGVVKKYKKCHNKKGLSYRQTIQTIKKCWHYAQHHYQNWVRGNSKPDNGYRSKNRQNTWRFA